MSCTGCKELIKFVNLKNIEINRVFNFKDVDLYISKIDEVLKRKEVYFPEMPVKTHHVPRYTHYSGTGGT